jgi:ketosteroid isomerase-like protein
LGYQPIPTWSEVPMPEVSRHFARHGAPSHHWFRYVLLAFLGALLTFAAARAQQIVSDDATFRALIDQYCAAWSSGDPENAAKFYAKDKDLVFYDLTPFSYSGWKDYEAGVRKGFTDSVESVSLTAGKDLKVSRRGTVAWTIVSMHVTAKMKDGRTIDSPVRYTGIWERRGKSWVLVHEHLSVPMQG